MCINAYQNLTQNTVAIHCTVFWALSLALILGNTNWYTPISNHSHIILYYLTITIIFPSTWQTRLDTSSCFLHQHHGNYFGMIGLRIHTYIFIWTVKLWKRLHWFLRYFIYPLWYFLLIPYCILQNLFDSIIYAFLDFLLGKAWILKELKLFSKWISVNIHLPFPISPPSYVIWII